MFTIEIEILRMGRLMKLRNHLIFHKYELKSQFIVKNWDFLALEILTAQIWRRARQGSNQKKPSKGNFESLFFYKVHKQHTADPRAYDADDCSVPFMPLMFSHLYFILPGIPLQDAASSNRISFQISLSESATSCPQQRSLVRSYCPINQRAPTIFLW